MTETAALPRPPLDVSKHVNFTLGMVLGVDDFDQEFAYLSSRDRWLARDLHGYGTTSGLAVTVEVDQQHGPRINVAPGAAVTPCGHLVCVSPAQCAYINEWLAANLAQVRAALAARPQRWPPPGTLPLYVALCYADCPTDDLPIPGEPCRTEDSLTAPSRVKDDFRLELRTARPAQREEDAVRDLVHWLRLIPIVDGSGSSTGELVAALRAAVAQAAEAHGSPPGSPPESPPGTGTGLAYDFVWGMPPPVLVFGTDDLAEQLRVLFGVWVTELRPMVRQAVPGCADCGCGPSSTSPGCGCGPGFGDAGMAGGDRDSACCDAVLLAEVEITLVETLGGGLEVADDGWRVDESERPYLLHTRLLQELLLTGAPVVTAGSPPAGPAGPSAPPISAVTASQVTGPPTAAWDPATRTLELGIPAGAGVDSVVVTPLPAGTPPTVVSFTGGVLTLGIANGRDGSTGPGITAVNAVGLPPGSAPTANLAGQVLTLGIPAGASGPPGSAGPPVVAAGSFGPQGGVKWTFQGLQATPIRGFPIIYLLTFDSFDRGHPYAVTGMAVTAITDPVHTIEVLRFEAGSDEEKEALQRLTDAMNRDNLSPDQGIVIRAVDVNGKNPTRGFTLEITDYFGM